MFRMWGKLWKDNHLVKDTVACCGDYTMSRTQMVFQTLDEICHTFDLERPIWLEPNIKTSSSGPKRALQMTALLKP